MSDTEPRTYIGGRGQTITDTSVQVVRVPIKPGAVLSLPPMIMLTEDAYNALVERLENLETSHGYLSGVLKEIGQELLHHADDQDTKALFQALGRALATGEVRRFKDAE